MTLVALRAFAVLTLMPAFAHAGSPRQAVHMPLFFVENAGQYTPGTDLVLNDRGVSVAFQSRQVLYRFRDGREVSVNYSGSEPAHAHGLEPLDGRVNFLLGADAAGWHTGVETYSSVAYRDMWPGIDVLYSVHTGELKTEYQLAPGATTDTVRWRIDGADGVRLEQDGSLWIDAGEEELHEAAPQVFELDRHTGELRPVKGAFRILDDGTLGIETGPYDHANRLIFDPVIGYSTYFGGTGQSGAAAIAVDTEGNQVIAGYTTTFDIAVGAHTLGPAQRESAFVAKLTAAGNLIFCTYIGGTLETQALAVALDRFNNIYLAGATNSSDFPVKNAILPHLNGPQDAFVVELNPAGSAFVFSTFLGGSGADQANGIAINRQGDIFVAGDTQSTDFPVSNAIQTANGGGQDAFLVKLGISGSNMMWSTYLGGSGDEHAAAVGVDGSGSVIVAGSTLSSNFPVVNAEQPHSGGNQDAFVTKVTGAGNLLVFSTYLGGSGGTPGLVETATGIAIDEGGSIYVSGTTSSWDFPVTVGAFQTTDAGGALQAFATKLTATGTLVYNTYLGGSSINFGSSVAVDVAGNAHIAGYTASTDFPNLRGVQTGVNGDYDLFVAKLNPAGSGLIYSTLLGGSNEDSAAAIAVDRFANVVVAGVTLSTDFPVVNAFQTYQKGAQNALVARLPVGWKPTVVSFAPNANWSIDQLTNGGLNNGVAAVQEIVFGIPGDVPIAADWSNAGTQQIGVFRAGTWYLDINGDGQYGAGDRSFVFGQAGDVPIVGDWNGSGTIKAGLYRNGTFILDLSGHLSGVATGLKDASFAFGLATDVPVAGDWTGSGTSKVGVFRNGQWLLDWNGSHTVNGAVKSFGEAGDTPLVGDWDGSGLVKIGVFRTGEFILDYNGSWTVDQVGDLYIPFGSGAAYAMMMH